MTRFARSRWCRFTALLLSLAVLHSAPGLASYSALALSIKAAPAAGRSLPVARMGAANAGLIVPLNGPGHISIAPSLSGSLNMAPAPALSVPSDAPLLLASPGVISAPAAANDAALVPASGLRPAAAAPRLKAAADSPRWVESAAPAAASIEQAASALQAVKPSAAHDAPASGLAALPLLSRVFDASRARAGLDAAPVAGAVSAFNPLAAAAEGPNGPANVPPAPPSGPAGPNAAPSTPFKLPVGVGLALAIGGGAAAWWFAPVLLPYLAWALGHIPFVTVPALPLFAYQTILVTLGAGAGLSAYSLQTWREFPGELKGTTLSAARTTFRFWARFGLIFDAVLRGKSTDAAQKAELPAGLFQYPLGAWIPVLIGYVATPVAFVIGAAWRLVGTPLLAAWRGFVDVAVGFFPWLARVFRFIGKVLRNIVPFAAGLVWGAVRGAFLGAAAGAVTAAAPVARDVVAAPYAPKTIPGWAAYRLLQLAGLVATVAVGAVGAVAGLLVSPVHVVLSALRTAVKWSDVSDTLKRFFARYENALSEDAAFNRLIERGSKSEGSESLAARGSRLLNGTLSGIALVAAYPFLALATLIRSLNAAARGVEVEHYSTDFDRNMPVKGEERPVDANPAGAVIPAFVGASGAVIGVLAYAALAPSWLVFGGLAGLAMWPAAALAGFGLGLALSQLNALVAVPRRVLEDAKRSGQLAWTIWNGTGRAAATAVFGTEKAAWLGAVLAAIPGAVMTLVSGLRGVVYAVASGLGKAAWAGFVQLIERFIPALKRLLSFLGRLLRNILPFAFGFIWGGLVGLFKVGGVTALSFFRPVIEAFEAEDGARTRPSEAQIGLGLVLGLTLLAPALAVFAGGFVLGAVAGLPVILTFAVARGIKWSKPSERAVAYFRAWERTGADRAGQRMILAVSGVFAGVGPEMPVWRVYVRAASALLGAPVSALTLLLAGYKGYFISFREAREAAAGRQLPSLEDPKAPSTGERTAPEAVPAGKPPVAVAAVAGVAGLAAGVAALWFFGLPFLAGLSGWALWAGYAGVFAGLPLLGVSTGLALTQGVFWRNLLPLATSHGAAGMRHSYGYWKNSGDAALEGVLGVKRGSPLTFLHRVVGAVTGAVWAVAGAVYGAGAAFAVGAYEGARQVVYEILPALRVAFETVMKVLRRIVPFLFGLAAGVVGGVIGSAAFGAMLLGRPYFSHVVTEDFDKSGVLAALGNIFLKLVALALGVLFGLGGVAAGVIVALPYSLTSAVALAFRWADIGGPAQRFFDHWSFGALREELRRVNQLTSKFSFEDSEPGRDPSLAAGWIRMANIFPATFAALFASIIAGYVGFVRSLGVAYRTSTSGGPIPEPTVDEQSRREWDRTWRAAGRTAAGFWWWGIIGGAAGLGIMLASSWTPLGLAGWLLVGAAAVAGVTLALGVGVVIALVALMYWINGQLR